MKNNKIIRTIINFTWLFIIGAVCGFIIETSWHFIKNGVFINKQGLWYGPFKPIYGLGLTLITGLLYKFKDKKIITIFLLGTIIGTVFEYLAALFQEVFLNTYTWTYASFNLNINGKIYLPYCLFWGLLSVLWVKFGLKIYLKIFDKLDSKVFTVISIVLFIFMIYNASLTYLIVDRYSKRYYGIASTNVIEDYIDKKYSDDIVKKHFPKLRVKKG